MRNNKIRVLLLATLSVATGAALLFLYASEEGHRQQPADSTPPCPCEKVQEPIYKDSSQQEGILQWDHREYPKNCLPHQ